MLFGGTTVAPDGGSAIAPALDGGSVPAPALDSGSVTPALDSGSVPAPALDSGSVSSGHPLLLLNPSTLSSLKVRAQGSAATWTRLRNTCNSYLGGTVEYPDGATYPNLPNIGSGYQGDGYLDPVLNIGLCYQIGIQINDPNVAQWGQKGTDLLQKMSNPSHSPSFGTDSGYGIRNYGVGMSIGFDWLYQAMSSALVAQVYTQLNGWIAYFDNGGFGRNHPCGNYFAGYYATKAYAGLATAGDNPKASATWGDFLNRLHLGGPGALGNHVGVQAYFKAHMTGGGWPEGWGYGPRAAINMSLPALAAKTAKGLDLIHDPVHPYSYPLDNGMHLMQLTWPSLDNMDGRDTLHSGNDPASFPAAPNVNTFTVLAGVLARYADPLAPQYHAYAKAIRLKHGLGTPWIDFIFWDPSAAEKPYSSLPLSFKAGGLNTVAMRSNWTTSAVWGSFRASAYVNYDGSGEQYHDAGSLAIVRGATPFLVNTPGFLVTSYPGTSVSYGDDIYQEIYGSGKPGRIFNTFYNGTTGQTTAPVDGSPPPTTRVSRFEDGKGYVLVRADGLKDVYTSGVTGWSRSVVYFRPNHFVVFDRTTVADTQGDQHMNWHVALMPAQVGSPSAGAVRHDVSNATAGFIGAVTTLLPANATVGLVNVFGSNKAYRLEVRPPVASTSMSWLTVFDTATSSGQVAVASALTSSNGPGALLKGAKNLLALFVEVQTGGVAFTIPAAKSTAVIAGLSPGASYKVTAAASGTSLSINVQPGGGFAASTHGTLYLDVSASGVVTAAQ